MTGWTTLAEVSAVEAIIGATATALVLVASAIGGVWLKIQDSKNKAMVELAKVTASQRKQDTADERKSKKDAVDEYQEILSVMRQDRESDRKTVHDLRNDLNASLLRLGVCEVKVEECEQSKTELMNTLRAFGVKIKSAPPSAIEGDDRD